jgi:predicted nucleic acid-binding protein
VDIGAWRAADPIEAAVTTAVLDTSVLVRYLTRDDPTKADAAKAYIASASEGALLFPSVALAELGFVLSRVYRWPVAVVAGAIRAVASHPAIDVPDMTAWLDVADDLESGRGLVDAYLMRVALEAGAPTLVTFDDAIKPLAGLTCRQP